MFAIQGVGNHLGRIVVFVCGFMVIALIACVAGTTMRQSIKSVGLFALAAASFSALGSLWIWINLFVRLPGLLLLIAAGLAAAALAGAFASSRNRLAASLSATLGICVALVIIGLGLTISIAPGCGSAGNLFHIDKWSRPAATVYVCGDGRLSFEFIR
jgi:hypothetical protein